MALIPIAVVVPIAIEEAVATAVGAATLLGYTTSHAFTSTVTQAPPSGVPHEEAPPPRMVTAGEQALAQSIADRIDAHRGVVRDIYEFELFNNPAHEAQPDQETPPQDKMTDAGNQLRRITTAMTAIEAATIAAPGKVHIQTVQNFVQQHGVAAFPTVQGVAALQTAQAAFTTLVVDVQRLLASLATPAGIA